MAYFTGQNLSVRVNQMGLDTLYDLLKGVADDKQPWPAPYVLNLPDRDMIEPVRVVLYSVLTELNLKPYFKVKRTPGGLIIDQASRVGKILGGFDPGMAGFRKGEYTDPETLEPIGDEGAISLLEMEDDTSKN